MENDSKFQLYANDLVINVPFEYLQYLIALFMQEAAINMGSEVNEVTLERTIYHIKKDYGYIPINYIASAFVRGSLGKIGDGKGRLIPKTIMGWIADMSMEYNRMLANQREREKLNDVTIAMNLHKYPVSKAIIKKIDWITKGKITSSEWDNIPLKELSEVIAAGHTPDLEYFGIKPKP